MEKDKSKKNTLGKSAGSSRTSQEKDLDAEQSVDSIHEGVAKSIKSEDNIQLTPISSKNTVNRAKNYLYLNLALTSLFQYLKKYKTRLRNLGLVTIIGIGLSVLALYLDHSYSRQSSIGQEDIKENQEVLRSDLEQVPNATAKRIAELVGLKDVITKGPIKDLVELVPDSDAVKRAADAKVNSGNRALEIDGAKELETIAKKRVSALKELIKSTPNVKTARQRGNECWNSLIKSLDSPQKESSYQLAIRAEKHYLQSLEDGDKIGAFGLATLYNDERLTQYFTHRGDRVELNALGRKYMHIFKDSKILQSNH